VAGVTNRGYRRVIVIYVAGRTGHGDVRARQWKRGVVVIEAGSRPIRGGMANGAIGGKARGDVIGDCATQRCGALPCRQVAAITSRGIERVIVADMAGDARRGRRRNVHAGQCKAGSAVIKRRRIPTDRGMAGGAVGGGKC